MLLLLLEWVSGEEVGLRVPSVDVIGTLALISVMISPCFKAGNPTPSAGSPPVPVGLTGVAGLGPVGGPVQQGRNGAAVFERCACCYCCWDGCRGKR